MKNFLFTLSVFLMANLVVNGQEIIETKPIEDVQIPSAPYSRIRTTKSDSATAGIKICTPSRAGQLAQNQALFVFNYEGKQLRTTINKPFSYINPNWISNLNVLKDDKSTEMYGLLGKNGVIIIGIKDEFARDFKKFLKREELI